ncbi:MAG: MATE family efflux transporter [candidate division KSB1 bacterium]|nr:MATE family efflux transporter [candidate division KSB1 bacterium]
MLEENLTSGVRTLRGDPRKAIVKLSAPMVVANVVQAVYNLADGIWVAGLGADALAGVGLFFPFFMIMLSLAAGMAIGGSAAVSRRIGARDKAGSDSAAVHTLAIGLGIAVTLTLVCYPLLSHIFRGTGVRGPVLELTLQYGRILVAGSVLLVFSNLANGILRGEGDSQRAMLAMVLGSLLNIGLDPLFIYTLGMGIAGAAWATLLSIGLSAVLMGYWIFVRRSTYVRIRVRAFRYDGRIAAEILRVGVPASFAQLSMAAAMFVLNAIVVRAGGTDGVAIFTSAWRIIMFGLVPLFGIATGVTAVTGAAYGARDVEKLRTGYFYGIEVGLAIEGAVFVSILLLAPRLAYLFTYAEKSSHLARDLSHAMRILACFLPTVPLGMLTGSMFQGIGKGENSLAVTVLRTLVLQIAFGYLLGLSFALGLEGVWWGIVSGNVLAALVSFLWGRYTVRRLEKRLVSATVSSEAEVVAPKGRAGL